MSHTPGPWNMQPSSDGAHSKRIFANGNYLATVGGSDQSWPELVANARLIAAAPEMYKALEMALEAILHCYDVTQQDEAVQTINASIAKAKGETE